VASAADGAGAVLVLNAGSSSLKLALFEPGSAGADPLLLLRGQIEGIGREPAFRLAGTAPSWARPPGDGRVDAIATHQDAIDLLLDWLGDGPALRAAGHRVVHGGARYAEPQRITPELLDSLRRLVPLAPHHQPHNLAAIEAVGRRLPALPQVACFDTAFHAGQPAEAVRFGLPRALHDQGLRRYGFHGLSYEYVVGALPRVSGAPLPRRLTIAHLGNGASLAAVRDGTGCATTMGFSTLDGLIMGTRCGALDPGVILHLLREGHDLASLTALLYDRSGLLGVSGLSADMRSLTESDAPEAAEAVALFCYRIARELGSLAAALEGLDALVFTGGIGEHAPAVRAAVCARAAWLGVHLDEAANRRGGPLITTADSKVAAWVVPTNEELVIARHCEQLIG